MGNFIRVTSPPLPELMNLLSHNSVYFLYTCFTILPSQYPHNYSPVVLFKWSDPPLLPHLMRFNFPVVHTLVYYPTNLLSFYEDHSLTQIPKTPVLETGLTLPSKYDVTLSLNQNLNWMITNTLLLNWGLMTRSPSRKILWRNNTYSESIIRTLDDCILINNKLIHFSITTHRFLNRNIFDFGLIHLTISCISSFNFSTLII